MPSRHHICYDWWSRNFVVRSVIFSANNAKNGTKFTQVHIYCKMCNKVVKFTHCAEVFVLLLQLKLNNHLSLF